MPRKRERLDDGPYVLAVWAGLVFTGVYVMATKQIITSIPDWFENLLGLAIGTGAGICLAGSRVADWRVAYHYELGGLALIIVTLGVLAVATDLSLVAQLTLGGGLGGWIQVASIVLAANLWRALRTS